MWLEYIGEDIDQVVFYVIAGVSAFNVLLIIVNLIIGAVSKVKIPGHTLDFYVVIGSIPLMTTVLIRGIDWDYSTDRAKDVKIICQVFPSLLGIGLLWVTGTPMVKAIASLIYFGSNSKQPIRLEWVWNLLMVILTCLSIAYSLIWVILFGMGTFTADDSIYECTSDYYTEFQLSISLYHACILLIGTILLVPAMFTSKDSGRTSISMLALATFNMLFVALAASLMHFFYKDKTTFTGNYAINAGLMTYAVLFNLIVILISKLMIARKASTSSEESSLIAETPTKKRKQKKSKHEKQDERDEYATPEEVDDSCSNPAGSVLDDHDTFQY